MIQNIFITISAFVGMEFIAWAAHKYVMHGFLWFLHEDHHVLTGKPLQKNDSFALIFAIPSALGFILGSLYNNNILFYTGLGILFYGIAYLFVHDIFICKIDLVMKGSWASLMLAMVFATCS